MGGSPVTTSVIGGALGIGGAAATPITGSETDETNQRAKL